MIIREGEKRLVRAGLSRVVYRDAWSVALETQGLGPDGAMVTYRIALSFDEIEALHKAKEPKEVGPVPVEHRFRVTGTAHYADGFEFEVEAFDEDIARAKARLKVERSAERLDCPHELQEVCIDSVVKIETAT